MRIKWFCQVSRMSNPPPAPPSLDVLRQEIDSIDEQVHRLLMARGDIIDRLIQVKQTQEVGSAFRPAREASMMRRLVERHRGILPIDTIESIWRVIISTFTYVQAPFSVHADVSVGESAMRDSARFHFGFVVPYVSHFSAQAAVEAVAKSKGDLALVPATSSRTPWWIALEAEGAPKIIARLPFLERADHPAALPVFVVSRVADSAMVTEVETWSVRVSGWNAEIARALSPLAEIVAVPDTAFDGAALLVSVSGSEQHGKDQVCHDRGRRVGALARLSSAAMQRAIRCPRTGRQALSPQGRSRYSGVEDVPPRAESRHSRNCALHAGQIAGAGAGPQGVQAVGQRDPARALAEGGRRLQERRRSSGGLSGRHLARAARSHRPRLWARPRPHHLRRRLRRNPQSSGAHLSPPWRRGDLHRARLSGVSDRDMANSAINVVAPETEFTADVDAILARVSPRTKLVWLANPNNPTGTYLPFNEIKRLRAGLPAHVLLVLDAAYSDYVSRNDYEIGIELVATTENTVMTHTFSKIHGLASLRIGWMFGPANIVDAVNRIRGPFNVSTPAMLAAVAAIEDTAHIQMSKAHTEKWRNWLTEEIDKARPQGDAERGEFHSHPFPAGQGQDRRRRRCVPHQARPGAARRCPITACRTRCA